MRICVPWPLAAALASGPARGDMASTRPVGLMAVR
jgi:hypothetical protein